MVDSTTERCEVMERERWGRDEKKNIKEMGKDWLERERDKKKGLKMEKIGKEKRLEVEKREGEIGEKKERERFTGSIPISFSNASGLQKLELSSNNFTGLVPVELGTLQYLSLLNLGKNQLGSDSKEANNLNVITYLVNCSSLQRLSLAYNRLSGKLPNSIANLSTQLETLALGGNLIHGSIFIGIENLINLTTLGLEENFLSGSIPFGIGKLPNLNKMSLYQKNFSGNIPSSLGNLTQLLYLFMDGNSLEGSIPSSLGNCTNLVRLWLASNILSGTIPKQVVSLTSLLEFHVDSNFFSGPLPFEIVPFCIRSSDKEALDAEVEPSMLGLQSCWGSTYADELANFHEHGHTLSHSCYCLDAYSVLIFDRYLQVYDGKMHWASVAFAYNTGGGVTLRRKGTLNRSTCYFN
ncbi:hypothetical protein GIB67_019923 [Kingdonia uniflora]|uniref:Uncharacterized protein n=1 Tax=Kingdonia uniflora TaxID=39325 RepID=A0A7J7MKL6_9MAGN|nr:hypothetical protein GIB67_019923 [Kingdonia uniflora]